MSKTKTWREVAAPIIHNCLKANEGKTEKEKRAALRDAYPFGERAYHPYKVWCDEVKRQLGLKRTKAQMNMDSQPQLFL